MSATPQGSGKRNSICKAMALPTSSARSQATIATSASNHSGKRQARGNRRAQAWARSIPVAMPSLQHNDCSSIAMALERATIQSNW